MIFIVGDDLLGKHEYMHSTVLESLSRTTGNREEATCVDEGCSRHYVAQVATRL